MIFVDTFTKSDISRAVASDAVELSDAMSRRLHDAVRKALKATSFPCVFNATLTTKNKNRYIVLFYFAGKKKAFESIFLEGTSGKGACYYEVTDMWHGDSHASPMCFTSHFLRRYSERTGIQGDAKALLSKLSFRNAAQAVIYIDERNKRKVYACIDGLMLIQKDVKKDILMMNTFVSNGMLARTQREAKKAVDDVLREYDGLTRRGATRSEGAFLELQATSKFNMTNEIYKQYFDND